MIEEPSDFYFKIVLIGDSGVGKTNILSRFTLDKFNENSKNTIGADFSSMDLMINNKSIKTQFWDTAGQEKYRAMSSAYYKNCQGAFVVYDITNRESFENLNSWLLELKEHGDKNILIFLIGNKNDLKDKREIMEEEGSNFAKKEGIFFKEVSAKDNNDHCINNAFDELFKEILKVCEKENRNSDGFITKRKHSVNLDIHDDFEGNNIKKSCC